MRTIGFIDYYLDEWHASEYPSLIKDYNEKYGEDFVVKYAWAEIDSPSGKTNAEWCEEHGVTLCNSLEEVCKRCDCIILLAPDNPEVHLRYAKRIFASGKPTFIDKTFVSCYNEAEEIYEAADEAGARFFSTSALRYAEEIAPLCGSKSVYTVGGGPSPDAYIIHQVEMLVSCIGTGAKKVRVTKDGASLRCEIEYPDERRGGMCYNPDAFYYASSEPISDGEGIAIRRNFFIGSMAAILDFFKSNILPFSREQTLECMKIRDGVLEGIEKLSEWINL